MTGIRNVLKQTDFYFSSVSLLKCFCMVFFYLYYFELFPFELHSFALSCFNYVFIGFQLILVLYVQYDFDLKHGVWKQENFPAAERSHNHSLLLSCKHVTQYKMCGSAVVDNIKHCGSCDLSRAQISPYSDLCLFCSLSNSQGFVVPWWRISWKLSCCWCCFSSRCMQRGRVSVWM